MAGVMNAVVVTGPVASVVNTFWELEREAPPLLARSRAYSDSMLLQRSGEVEVPCKGEDFISESTSCASSSWDIDSDADSAQVESSHFDTDDEADDKPMLATEGWRCGLFLQPLANQSQVVAPMASQGLSTLSLAPRRSKPSQTTLILKSLPRTVTRTALCHMLDAAGFAGLYDFLYLPVNFKTWRFFRYCIVNFIHEDAATTALEQLASSSLAWPMAVEAEDLTIEVAWCDRAQGLAAHLEQYRNSPVMHASVPDEYKPMLLCNGHRMAFPPPTTALAAPNTRKSR
jgi:hypothetical protein